jgi:hypothetical protein
VQSSNNRPLTYMRETAFDSKRGSVPNRMVWRLRVRRALSHMGGKIETVADFGCGGTAPLLQELLKAGVARCAFGVELAPGPDLSVPGL